MADNARNELTGPPSEAVLISGASSGIGLATAKALLLDGYTVIGLARSFEHTQFKHPNFRTECLDLCDLDELPQHAKTILASLKTPLRAVINNAGVGKMGYLEQLSIGDIQQTFQTNLLSHVILTKAVLPYLKQQNSLSDLVFLGSEAALKGAQQGSIYCASKFALRGFAQALREECAKSSVRVSIVNPGAVRTEFFDELRFEPGAESDNAILPEDVAAVLLGILNTRAGTVIDEINLSPMKHVWQRKP